MPNYSDNSFTQAVKDYLLSKHNVCYNGKFIYITPDDEHADYSLQWLENNQDRPYVVMGDFANEEDFLTYVKKDIDSGRFFLKQVFVLRMETDPKTHKESK